MRKVPPAHALADERDLRLGLHRQLALDLLDDAYDRRPRERGECRPPVAEDPGVAVLIRADRAGEPGVGERSRERVLGRRVARVLEVVLDPVDRRPRLGVLHLEPGHHECSQSVGADDERDRSLGRREREAGVVEDVVRVEEHDPGETRCLRLAEQDVAARAVLRGRDRNGRDHPTSLVPPTCRGREDGRGPKYIQIMSMRNFLIALGVTALFLGILLLAGTAQNEGCLPWKEPITVGGGGTFSESPGTKICR